MSYSTEVVKQEIPLNVVVSIGGIFYGKNLVDSGLVIPDEHLILDDPKINGASLDIRSVSTPVGGVSFKLKDENEYITRQIMLDPNFFLEKTVIMYAGFSTGSFDWSDYKVVGKTRVNNVTKISNGYSVTSKEVTSLVTNPTYNIDDKLEFNILTGSVTFNVLDGDVFPSAGLVRIDNEFIRYTTKVGNTLSGLTRGAELTTAAGHDKGAEVYLVTELIDENPINMILQLLLSKNGDLVNDPTYDIFINGLGLTGAEVNIAEFESVRDVYFSGEQFRLYMYNVTDTLKFIEKELLKATNCRMFSDDGKINISVLDQVDRENEVFELDENIIIGTPTWTLGSDKIVNVIKIRWDYDDASGTYNESTTFKDDESIEIFGEKKPLVYNFRGIKADLSGAALIQNRANRLLSRLSTPRGKVTVNAQFDASEVLIGGNILLVHRFLPQQGAGLGVNDRLEVMSKSIDLSRSTVRFKLEYTSFTGIRIGFIAPSPIIVSVTSQKVFEVPDGTAFKAGFALLLYDDLTSSYYPDTVNIIESVDGNIITMANDFTTILTDEVRVKLSEYPLATAAQKSKNAFVGENGGFFDDETKSYQIIY